jgi:hypothetical protein
MDESERSRREPGDIRDVIEDLEDLEEMVDDEAERAKVRETMEAAEKAQAPGLVGQFRRGFGLRDAGEAVIGGFVFGVPSLAVTILFGGSLILGILYAGGFEQVREDRLLGVVPLRLIGILCISIGLAVSLLTVWGQVDWSDPMVAGSQTTLVAIAMGVGGSVGDILPG